MRTRSFISAVLVFCMALTQAGTVLAAGDAGPFNDVPAGSRAAIAIQYLKDKGIISGYPDGTFKPDQAVNRAEALKLILGAAKIEGQPAMDSGSNADFSDIPDWNVWYYPYVNKATDLGIVSGYDDFTFRPNQTVNLVESLKMIRKAENIDISSYSAAEKPYNDALANLWYSQDVSYAHAKNILLPYDGNIYPDQPMNRGMLADILYRFLFIQERNLDAYPKGVLITSDADESISFSTAGLDVTIFKDWSTAAADAYTAQSLEGAAQECGTIHAPGYFNTLVGKMTGAVTTYTFVENKPAQENHYEVQYMLNSFGYTDLKSFKNDFDICAAGGIYPYLMNSAYLVSVGSCGGAIDDSGLPQGCGEIQKVVEPSLKLR
jgi:hypothetical protein